MQSGEIYGNHNKLESDPRKSHGRNKKLCEDVCLSGGPGQSGVDMIS